jgi:hypothetical protein
VRLDDEQVAHDVADALLDLRHVVPTVQRRVAHLRRDAQQVVCHGFNVARRSFQNVEQLCNSVLERGLAQDPYATRGWKRNRPRARNNLKMAQIGCIVFFFVNTPKNASSRFVSAGSTQPAGGRRPGAKRSVACRNHCSGFRTG